MIDFIDNKAIIKKALKVRKNICSELDSSFCVFELAESMDMEVRFIDLTTLEGAILVDSKLILLSTFRPEGRLRFTCAHELGHYLFGHGDTFDYLKNTTENGQNDYNERICDLFASSLLMPRTTVCNGFIVRGWDYANPTASQVYCVAGWLGVGYLTLVNQMFYTLRLISRLQHTNLSKIKKKGIKKDLLGVPSDNDVVIVDKYWRGRPVEVEKGDYIISYDELMRNDFCLEKKESDHNIVYRAVNAGETVLNLKDARSIKLRIRKEDYTGRSKYRYLEE